MSGRAIAKRSPRAARKQQDMEPTAQAQQQQRQAQQQESDLAEVLDVEAHVDMAQIVALSRNGVPERLRPEAWKYMLGVSRPERSEEMSLRKRFQLEYADLEKAWRAGGNAEMARAVKAEVKPHRTEQGASWDAKTRGRLESILCCYLHAQGEELMPGTAYLLCPFVHVFPDDVEAYACFVELTKSFERGLSFEGCKQMHVTFMTLLRHTLPELYRTFEEQECLDGGSGHAWLASWLRFLLARELPLPCVLRLWDTYLSYFSSHGREATLQLHIYVCLATLEACNEDLMELDAAEVLWYLQHLPELDVAAILTQAVNIKDDVIARSIL